MEPGRHFGGVPRQVLYDGGATEQRPAEPLKQERLLLQPLRPLGARFPRLGREPDLDPWFTLPRHGSRPGFP